MSSYSGTDPDETFITFSNLPEVVTVKIYTLAGTLVRTLDQSQKSSPTSPFLRWNLQNEDGLRVASGLYLAIVSSPTLGDKVLKFSIIMPQKQLQNY
jgi:flagellar hook assembly protein FlgD